MMKGIEFGPDLKVRLPARFNVAVPFVDRHLTAGPRANVATPTPRHPAADAPAARGAAAAGPGAQLAGGVNRAGNRLLAAGLKPGDRLRMVVKDCPAFFYL